jgi:hypothetical protein
MASKNTMFVSKTDKPKEEKLAKGVSTKSGSKQKIEAGPKGKMQKFTGVKTQKPGGSAVTNTGGGSYKK